MFLTLMAASILFTILAVISRSEGNSEIPLSCCGNHTVTFKAGCEMHASRNHEPFATFEPGVGAHKETQECQNPCKRLTNGLMILDGCAKFDMNVVCIYRSKVKSDDTLHYYEQPCNSIGSSCVERFLLLVLLIVKCWMV